MITRRIIPSIVLLLICLGFPLAQSQAEDFDHSYESLDSLLTAVVQTKGAQSLVNYKRLTQSPELLTSVTKELEAVSYRTFLSFNNEEKLSFLINAYNTYTLKLIADNYPVASIRDIQKDVGSWDYRFIPILGKTYTLNEIEHSLIREKFKEPRIHFALVCAAKSCPPLLNGAYRPLILDKQLEDASRNFIQDTERNRYDDSSKTLYLSKIFEWYQKDFGGQTGLLFFVASRLNGAEKTRLLSASVSYMPYDWSLNDAS